MLYNFDIIHMDNYCFRRKRHSYAACDAALAASLIIIVVQKLNLRTLGIFSDPQTNYALYD